MASGAPRGHITTGIFSTDKVIKFSRSAFQLIDELLIEQMTNSSAIIEQAYNAKIYADFLKVSENRSYLIWSQYKLTVGQSQL